MADLISYVDFIDWMGSAASAVLDQTQVEKNIRYASAQVREEASPELDAVDYLTPAPDVIELVVCSAVRRSLVNPDGNSSEMLDGHRVDGSSQAGVFLSDKEKQIVKRWAGVSLSAQSLPLAADVPTPRTESVPVEEVGWARL